MQHLHACSVLSSAYSGSASEIEARVQRERAAPGVSASGRLWGAQGGEEPVVTLREHVSGHGGVAEGPCTLSHGYPSLQEGRKECYTV